MGKRILIIEDDPEMINLARLFLERAGYEVLSAVGGEVGLEVLRNEPVDLVLLDIMMPDMDGWDVLKAVRADEQWQDLPVIMLSARHYLEDEEETEAYAHMFTDYVVKPFVVRDLLAKIGSSLKS